MMRAKSFTFRTYKIDPARSTVTFTYRVKFKYGLVKAFTDTLIFPDVTKEMWEKTPESVLEPTLQSLLLMVGINYWCAFPTKNIYIEGFKLSREQADFWNSLYLNGLGEFFYDMKIDFRGLVAFPYDESYIPLPPVHHASKSRALLLNGAGKDSILSAELLKAGGEPFDFFAFAPTPAHKRIAELVGSKNIRVTRKRDPWLEFVMSTFGISSAYPSVSTFTFIAVLLAQVMGYDKIIFSNERSADFGNLKYLGLEVNHQWCKSTEAEKITNDYIERYVTPDITSKSLLRTWSELEIVRRFVQYPQYLDNVTSCNMYFWLLPTSQYFYRKAYWCKRCPKCVFLFACFSAFLPKDKVVGMFGANLYERKRILPLFKRILGLEGFKPLDCVGEPEEMILAMHYASRSKQYTGTCALELFENNFPSTFNFKELERGVFS